MLVSTDDFQKDPHFQYPAANQDRTYVVGEAGDRDKPTRWPVRQDVCSIRRTTKNIVIVVIVTPWQLNVYLPHFMDHFGWNLKHVTGSCRGSK